ncbi:MAG: phospholipase D family protein [Deltaproteobacteria bacterium]|nr:phospholipase D family protein [Deltaproteobacteria bacterium]
MGTYRHIEGGKRTATRIIAIIFWITAFMVLLGCQTLPIYHSAEPTYALTHPDDSPIGKKITPVLAPHPGLSGFYLLDNGLEAFAARALIVDAAQRTIDVQYYMYLNDNTGKLLMERLLRAADRGVRVRLLFDDLNTAGGDRYLEALDTHPNIQVRLFNPFHYRSSVSRIFDMIGDFGRLNRRMHNKLIAADNIMAITGGRNIGDEYFGARTDVNFNDIDLLAVGPIVKELSGEFDVYWNSDVVFSIKANRTTENKADLQKIRQHLSAHLDAMKDSDYIKAIGQTAMIRDLLADRLPLIFAQAKAVYDAPQKVITERDKLAKTTLAAKLGKAVPDIKTEVLIWSPYFVPGKSGIASLRKVRDKGVRIRVLTNSLAATDVAAVHAGYSRYRIDMLKMGIELYELKRQADNAPAKGKEWIAGSSGASLHAKTFVYDRQAVFIGSMNLDPRSLLLNTEIGLVIYSGDLAGQVANHFEEGVRPEVSYRVMLAGGKDAPTNGDQLVWTAKEHGNEVRYTEEPGVDFWQQVQVGIMSLFPIEGLL